MDVLKQEQGKAGVPNVSQPISGSQAIRQIENGQAVPVGYSRDTQGRLRDSQGRYVSNPDNPKVGDLYSRPSLRVNIKEQIMADYEKLPNGDYRHKTTRTVVKAPVDFGHAYGYEHRRLVLAAQQTGLTQAQFNDFVNSRPDYFRLENRADNQSHRYEKPGNGDLQKIIEDINKFKTQRGIK
ncbi:GH-E family nuclease [Moraxella cuniculi]|uniref:Toxin YqcG C-terminal domain-containing protein n=1 Tax=Moraxella cuniculi TaxID=34061 RepID=A0A448GUT5_9GAMM|nr:GH-E family nuclease [Moraxella cuniculi]VEG12517.1 Uncharacterised protein [Moraxella cuniculi]